MKKTALIWRESVYHNRFRCNLCGVSVAGEDGIPLERTIVLDNLLLCPQCHNVVCKMKELEAPENIIDFQCAYSEYIGGVKSD